MSERMNPGNNDDELFKQITKGLDADTNFHETLEAYRDGFEAIDTKEALDVYQMPHVEYSLASVRKRLLDEFREGCDARGITPSTRFTDEDYQEVGIGLYVAMHNLQHELYLDDVITVSNGLVFEALSDDSMAVTAVPRDMKVIGTFTSPTISTAPNKAPVDEADMANVVLVTCVGLEIAEPMVIGADGDIDPSFFESKRVIIPLNVDTMELTKYHYPEGYSD